MVGAGVLFLARSASAAVPFPDAADWLPLQQVLLPIEDPSGDLARPGDPGADLVGDATTTALGWWVDDQTFFLRARVGSEPQAAGLWAFQLTVDGNNDNWELMLSVEGPPGLLRASTNPSGAFGIQVPRTVGDPLGYGSRATGETRTVVEGADVYVDLQIPRAVLEGELGVLRSGAIRVVGVTGATWDLPLLDVAGCDGAAGPCTAFLPVVSDVIRVDFDADGIAFPQELDLGTDPNDADSDDDGLFDRQDPDPLACDADGDGLSDGLEVGLTVRPMATDPAAGCFVADADPTGTTDPGQPDGDGDGRADGEEDADGDGAVGPWETDPTAADADTDGDGIADALDDRRGVGPDEDSDGDRLPDAIEGTADPDGDGLPSFVDEDSDDDGWSDEDEGPGDADDDGVPDALDLDSDEDGLPDALERGDERADPDADDDGIVDGLELEGDADDDGLDDRRDPDSDGDGIPDGVEGTGDTDGDGETDLRDEDSDDDGLPDALEFDRDADGLADDTDGDDAPDYLDEDSDDDGRPDREEGQADTDCDDLPDWLDDDRENSFCDDATVPAVDTGASPPDPLGEDPDPYAAPGGFGGGACDTLGNGAAGWLVVGLALALGRRRRAAATLLVPGAAVAEEVDADRFAPSFEGGELVLCETVGEDRRAGASAWLDHADDPLVYRTDEGSDLPVVHAVSTVRALGFVRAGPLRVGAEIPVHAAVAGPAVDGPTAMGDVRWSTETRVARAGAASLGVLVDGTLPTGEVGSSLGAGRARVSGAAAFTVDSGPWLVGVNAGVKSGTGRSLGSLDVTSAAIGAMGLAFRVTDGFSLAAEASGERWLGEGETGAWPVEGLLSARRTVGSAGAMHLAAGTGLTGGVGCPDLRLGMGLSWWLGGPGAG